MSDKKVIAVVSATGEQGGGLANAILQDPDGPFTVRALTRDAGSETARALAGRGAEVVEADLDDVDSLRRAFTGAHGAFVVTNFWESVSAKVEFAQAGNAARAAKDARGAPSSVRAAFHRHIGTSPQDYRALFRHSLAGASRLT